MSKRRKFVYTIWSHAKQHRYIVTPQQFEDRLAVELGDTTSCNGIGVTSANYTNSRKAIRKMKDPRHGGYIFNGISFRIYSEDEFNKRQDRSNYIELKESVYAL